MKDSSRTRLLPMPSPYDEEGSARLPVRFSLDLQIWQQKAGPVSIAHADGLRLQARLFCCRKDAHQEDAHSGVQILGFHTSHSHAMCACYWPLVCIQ